MSDVCKRFDDPKWRMRRRVIEGALAYFFVMTFVVRIRGLIDVGSWDESLYVHRAVYRGLLRADWGPIYSLYLSLFTWVSTDPINIFDYARLVLLFFVFPYFIFNFLSKLTGRTDVAALASGLIPALPLILKMDPGIQLFNFAVWILLLILAFEVRKRPLLTPVLAAVLGAMPFIRQDNTIYILGYSLFLIFNVYQHRDSLPVGYKNRAVKISALVAACAGLGFGTFYLCTIFLGGTPFAIGRTLLAFCDYYYWAQPQNFPPTGILDRSERVLQHFGNPSTLTELVLNNFVEVSPYFLGRIRGVLGSLEMFGGTPFLLSLLFTPFVFLRSFDGKRKAVLFLLILAVVKSFAVGIILAPQAKYFIELHLLVIMTGLWGLASILDWRPKYSRPVLISAVAAVVFFNAERTNKYHPGSFRSYISDLRSRISNEAGMSLKTRIFGTGPVSVFFNLAESNQHIFDYWREKRNDSSLTFEKFLNTFKVDVVVVGHDFRGACNDGGFGPDFQQFEKNFAQIGFRMVRLYQHGATLYLRNVPVSLGN